MVVNQFQLSPKAISKPGFSNTK